MLENIELFGNSLGVNNESVLQNIFDILHPIGEVYVQYPQQLSPYDLYNNDKIKSVWEEQLQYDGAFFRASNDTTSDNNHVYKVNDETQYYQLDSNNYPTIPVKVIGDSGGTITVTQDGNSITYEGKTYIRYVINNATRRASSYINETNGLVKQDNQNKYHYHNGNTGYAKTGISVNTNNNLTGSLGPVSTDTTSTLTKTGVFSNSGESGGGGTHSGAKRFYNVEFNGNHAHSITEPNSGSGHRHSFDTSYDGSSTDTEGRPDNYTYKIWKRIS